MYGDVQAVEFASVFFVLVSLLGVLLLATNLKQKWFPSQNTKKAEISPLPLPVEITKTLASKEEVQELERDMEKHFNRLQKQLDEQRTTARTAQSNVHKRIDKVVENTSEIKGELKQFNQNLNLLLEHTFNKK